jgi:hypothetical protein
VWVSGPAATVAFRSLSLLSASHKDGKKEHDHQGTINTLSSAIYSKNKFLPFNVAFFENLVLQGAVNAPAGALDALSPQPVCTTDAPVDLESMCNRSAHPEPDETIIVEPRTLFSSPNNHVASEP